jgi:hypothetical protein
LIFSVVLSITQRTRNHNQAVAGPGNMPSASAGHQKIQCDLTYHRQEVRFFSRVRHALILIKERVGKSCSVDLGFVALESSAKNIFAGRQLCASPGWRVRMMVQPTASEPGDPASGLAAGFRSLMLISAFTAAWIAAFDSELLGVLPSFWTTSPAEWVLALLR